jgi:hypothetical protein
MKIFETFTTGYDEVEDRISLVGSCLKGDVVQLWLNLRLMQKFLPPMMDWLKNTDRAEPAKAAQVQGFMQQSAREAMGQQPPVMPTGNSEKWLVRSLDLNWGPGQIVLVLKGEGDQAATIGFPTLIARQWLNVVYDLYRKADWPLTIWPDWMSEGAAAPATPHIVKH